MKIKLSGFILVAFILVMGINAFGQKDTLGYNPFVPKNLDDVTKLVKTPVVESSYHRYWIKGDPNYTDTSTYVWYVESGTFGVYDTLTDQWTPLVAKALGDGWVVELKSIRIDSTRNESQVWVRWDDGSGGNTGYVAVYERSHELCIVPDQITGFKHDIVMPPEVWFVLGTQKQCSDQTYSVSVMFNNINDYSFPYKLSLTYPDVNGTPVTKVVKVNSRDELDASLMFTFEMESVHDLNVQLDEIYTLLLDKMRDKYGSTGVIAPLGPPLEYKELKLTINHLPQTGGMTMD